MLQRSTLTGIWPSERTGRTRDTRGRAQQALLLVGLITIIAIVLCLYLLQASRVATTSYEITSRQNEQLRLQRENANMLAQLALARSTAEMDKRAAAAGFVTANINDDDYLAIQPQRPLSSPDFAPPTTHGVTQSTSP